MNRRELLSGAVGVAVAAEAVVAEPKPQEPPKAVRDFGYTMVKWGHYIVSYDGRAYAVSFEP